MAYGRGLEYLRQRKEELGIGQGEKREWMNQFWLLDDKDKGIFRFVNDGDELFVGEFHEEERRSRAGRTYKADVLCDGEGCSNCADGDRPWVKIVALVFVEAIDHETQNKDGTWKEIQKGNLKRYREDVADWRIWMIKSSLQSDVQEKYGEYGTLTNRYWELTRFGKRNQKGGIRYSLERSEVEKPSARCAEALTKAPDIETVVQENFGRRKKGGTKNIDAKESTGGFDGDTALPGAAPADDEPVDFD